MRFLHTRTGQFVDAKPKDVDYAILSHTWDRTAGEQTFQDLRKIQERYMASHSVGSMSDVEDVHLEKVTRDASIWDDPDLSPKTRDACRVARENGFSLIWIHSCCIDKTSSAELSEAINSMYVWYAGADVCYAYLADVPLQDDHWAVGSRFRRSLWFKRGWTLQELIAPFEVTFFSQDWKVIGSKRELVDLIVEVTTISAELCCARYDEFSVAQRLSWMSTRVDDTNRRSGLLAARDIRHLHAHPEEILQRTPDQSLFTAWASVYEGPDIMDHAPSSVTPWEQHERWFTCQHYSTFLPSSPSEFWTAGSITTVSHDDICRRLQLPHLPAPEYTSTPHGIRTRLPVLPLGLYLPPNAIDSLDDSPPSEWYLIILACESANQPGHLLGRVCHIPPSPSASGVEAAHSGSVTILLPDPERGIEVKTVHIPHPERKDVALLTAMMRPHAAIRLMLPRRVLNALREQGYTAGFRGPDQDHPTTHWLTLSADAGSGDVVIVEYQHTLTSYGNNLTVDGRVSVSRPGALTDPPPSEEVPELEVSGSVPSVEWSDLSPWNALLALHVVPVVLSDTRMITLGLGLNLIRKSYYSLDVRVVE